MRSRPVIPPGMGRITVVVPLEMRTKLKSISPLLGHTVTSLATEIFGQFIDKYEKRELDRK